MKLSAPIYRLKRQARILSRQQGVTHTQALNQIAQQEGFKSWGLLMRRLSKDSPISRISRSLAPGDLTLIGARPGHGKTLLSLEIAIDAMKAGRHCVFFSLEYSHADVASLFDMLGQPQAQFKDLFEFDNSDLISADYIITSLQSAPAATVVVVDYLQALDHRRSTPQLEEQVRQLRSFAAEHQLLMLFISQIHRAHDDSKRTLPSLADVRLPNPLDLSLFNKACFIQAGQIELTQSH